MEADLEIEKHYLGVNRTGGVIYLEVTPYILWSAHVRAQSTCCGRLRQVHNSDSNIAHPQSKFRPG